MKLWLYAVTLLAGICNAVEPGQNASLAKTLQQPWLAALVILGINVVIFFVVGLLRHDLSLPPIAHLGRVPWWAWLGGATSAIIITSQLFVPDEIGAGRFLGLVVTAGVVTSILLDNYGLVGFAVHPAGVWRILGGLLMIVGVTLVAVF